MGERRCEQRCVCTTARAFVRKTCEKKKQEDALEDWRTKQTARHKSCEAVTTAERDVNSPEAQSTGRGISGGRREAQ
eukprot:4763958-Pleurochrysis_carterae.AAC.2